MLKGFEKELEKECLQEEIGILKFNEFLLNKMMNLSYESMQRAKINKLRAECKVEILKTAYTDEKIKEIENEEY